MVEVELEEAPELKEAVRVPVFVVVRVDVPVKVPVFVVVRVDVPVRVPVLLPVIVCVIVPVLDGVNVPEVV